MSNETAISMMDAERLIRRCYELDEPLLLIGPPGIGKSALFECTALTTLKIGFIDFRLSMRDPVDVGGMRVPDTETGRMKHYVPDDLPDPKRHGKKGIVLFDEINAVSPMMQVTAYGLIQERRNGAYTMAKGWVPMGAGNHTLDRAGAQRISTALANRFNYQHVKPDLQSWLTQYGSQHVDTRGTAFLRFRDELFHKMPTADETAFPSARSWTKAFKFIDEEPRFRRKIFNGYVGEAAAGEFEAFWQIMENAVTLDQIVAHPKDAPIPHETEVGLYYAVCGMLARAADRKNFAAIMTYVDRLIPDYQNAIIYDATARAPDLKKTSEYGKWAVDHQEVTL